MTAVSAHELTRTQLCASPGCPYEAEPGSEKCAACARRNDRGARDGAPRRLARTVPVVAEADRKTCRRDGCEERSTGEYDRGMLANLCETHEEEAREQAGRESAERWRTRREAEGEAGPSRGGRPATWTREKALDHLRAQAVDGVAPSRIDALKSGFSNQVIARLFGTYTKMVEEAGLTQKQQRADRPAGPPAPAEPEAEQPPEAPADPQALPQPEGLVENARALLDAAEKVEDAYTHLAAAREAVERAKAEYRDALDKVALL